MKHSKRSWVAAFAVTLAVAASALQQERGADEDARADGLVPAPARDWQDQGSAYAFDAEAWKQSLGTPDLDARERSFERLVREARRHPEARAALEEWARASDVPELAWTSRLALREVRREPAGTFRLGPLGPGGPGGGARDPFASFLQRFPSMTSPHQLFEELERELQDAFQGLPSPEGLQGTSRSQGFHMESTPEGVRIKIVTEEDGKSTEKVYEGESLEVLLETYPELREHVEIGTPPDPSQQLDEVMQRLRSRFGGLEQPEQRRVPTDILGVYLEAPLEGEPELVVDRVQPGTIADALGIRRGDLLLEMNGTPLAKPGDIGRVLAERPKGEALRVVLEDRRGERRELTWLPGPEESGGQ